MTTTFVKGDLFEDSKGVPPPRAFAFAADDAGAMDSGVAIAFRKRWPALADAYRAHASGGKMQLGDVFVWREGDDVVYALGIHHGDAPPKVSVLKRALDTMVARSAGDGVTRIALPAIGAAKGGLDRTRVKKLLTETGEGSAVTLVVFEQFVRAKP